MNWCSIKKICPLAFFIFIQGSVFSQSTLFSFGSIWKYKDDGTNQGTVWRQVGFDDMSWASGLGQLGYGNDGEITILNACGVPVQSPPCATKYIGYYFRKTINIPDASVFKSFTFEMYRDDGAVVYVNGTEVYRNNLPAGTVNFNTLASTAADDDGNLIIKVTLTLAASQIQSGDNLIAVEVHQNAASSSDLTWDMKLTGIPVGLALITRGPYLQKATPTSMLVRWYTDDPEDSEVKYGTDPGNLLESVIVPEITNSHSVLLTGLTPFTKYYYSVGNSTAILQSGLENYFLTSPLPYSEGKYTFWAIGDMGDNSARQRNVRDRFNAYMGNNITNGWLLLGDNAYDNGTEQVYTSKFFEIYQTNIMRKSPLWPATGNHEYANSVARQIDQNIPYFGIFDLPTNGEAGGVPSNSEAYYSYDYGNIHFIALDSYIIENGTSRLYDVSGPQVQWLEQDLAANDKKWTIVYFHHPPYTKGSHNSDTESELRLIRENVLPILEQYDVDLVLSGHSHTYERSKLMKGHFGLESTFNPAIHHLSQSSGKYDGTTNSCIYTKDSPDLVGGTVYAVVGSSGRLDPGQPDFPHNAMYYGSQTNGGSLILEIEENRMDGKWLSDDGIIRDNFTIMKKVNKVNNINLASGESLQLQASWVGQYDWGHSVEATRTVTVTPASSLTYTVIDPNQCLADTYNVNVINTSITIDIPSTSFSSICTGSNVSVSYTASGAFSTGNMFTLQLSNNTGDFTTPVSIGSISSPTSGTINGLIPANTPAGSNFKFRIVSSDPVFAGSTSVSFAVNAPPVVGISSSQVCIGSAITLNPTTDGTWLSSDNTKAIVTDAGVVTGVEAGNAAFTYTNTATGCSSTTTSVTVIALPMVSAPSSQVCIGSTITLSPTTGGTWLSSDNSKATITNAGVVTGVSEGSATFTFTNATTGCSNTTTSVAINALPMVGASSQVCISSTITLSPSTGGIWLSSDNTMATVTNAGVVTGVSEGSATFSFTNTTTGCSNTTTLVTVNSLPALPLVSDVLYCQNATAAALTATANNGNTLQWYGTNSTGGIASTTAPTPSTGSTGTEVVYVSQMDNTTLCEGSRASITVTINELPAAPIVTDYSYCLNSTPTALSATSLSGHELLWYGTSETGGTSGTTAPTPSASIAGIVNYYVSQRNTTTGCESVRASIAVIVKLAPKPSVTASGVGTAIVLLTSSASNGNQWFMDGNAITGATSATYSVSDNGVYQVKVSLDACVSELSEPFTVLITALEDVKEPIALKLFPVPAQHVVNIQLTGVMTEDVSELIVFNVAGKVVDKKTIRGKETTLIIEEYLVGEYFLRISNKSFLLNSRLVKY